MPIAPASLRWLLGRTAWSAWIILAASLAVTAVVWALVRDQVRDEGRLRFDREVGRIAMAISNQVRVHAQVLRGAAGLFDVSPQVSRDTWRAYVDRLKLEQNYLGIQALGFAEVVTRDEVQEHVRRMRAAGFPDYEIMPGGERPVYAPEILFEPVNPQNLPALGFDILSDPVRAEAVQHALDTGDVAVSAEVQLEQDVAAADRSGFVLFMPIFRGGSVPIQGTTRRTEVVGYVFARFLSADFLGSILGGRQKQFRLRVYDGDGTGQPGPFFDSAPDSALRDAPTFGYARTVEIGLLQHHWTLRFDALTDDFTAIDARKPTIVLAAGTGASMLLFLLALTIAYGQEQVRQSKDDLAYLFEKNPGVMWVYDRDTLQFLAINEAAIELYGYSRDEFLQLRATDIRPPEDVLRLMDFLNTLSDGLQPGGEWRHKTKAGRIIDVAVASHGLRFAGRRAILGLVQDITERKRARAALVESERHFRTMADSMPALLAVGDAADDMVFVNKPWLDYTGVPFEQHLGQAWLDFIHHEDIERVARALQATNERREPMVVEYRLRRADGTYRWFADRGVPRFSPDGEFLGYIAVLFDITELRDAQSQLRQSQKMEAMGQLTGGVAHDFNNLLSVILGHAELLDDRFAADERASRNLKSIVAAASRAASLTNRLLAFSRRQQLKAKTIDVNDLILEIESMLRRTIGEHITVDMRLSEDAWFAIADPSQLEIALVNMIVNSRDAMPSGGRLIIGTSNVTLDRDYAAKNTGVEPGDYVLIAVTDTGEGIPPALIEKVFEPFFTTKEVGKGTGLGLSMVYGFVKQSGGHIRIDSEVAIGTTVKVYLPRSTDVPIRIAEPAECAQQPVVGGTETILVVEDDAMVRENMEGQLTHLGYRVIVAPDGPAALGELGNDTPIDLLFTDVIMPGGMNGRELAEQARKVRPALRVLFTSGYPEDVFDDDQWMITGGRLLAKPYRRPDLARKIRETLDDAG